MKTELKWSEYKKVPYACTRSSVCSRCVCPPVTAPAQVKQEEACCAHDANPALHVNIRCQWR